MASQKRRKGLIFIALVLIGAAALIGWNWYQNANKIAAVEVMRVELGEIVVKIPANGTLEEIEKEAIYYEATGKVEAVAVELGDKVVAGQVLARLETADLGNKLAAAGLQLEMERLNLAKMKKSREDAIQTLSNSIRDSEKAVAREEALYEAGAVSLVELEKNQQVLAELQKQYDEYTQMQDLLYFDMIRLEKQVEITRLNLEDLKEEQRKYNGEIVSPMDGVVTAVNLKKGELTNPTMPCFVVSQIDPLEINIYVNEYDISKVKIGQTVEIETDALSGVIFQGMVEKVAPIATRMATGQSTDTVVQVTIQVMKTDEMLKPGFSVKTEIISEKKENVIVLPFDAIQTLEDGSKVIYVVENDQVVRRTVETGIESDFDVEIIAGAQTGDLVILRPQPDLTEGMSVGVVLVP